MVSRAATLALLGLLAALMFGASAAQSPAAERYRNPLRVTIRGSGDRVETFADPHVMRGQDGVYYAYGTSDPLNDRDRDRDAAGALRTHRIPTLRSTDLVHWTYVGDAFSEAPAWLAPDSPQWAPDVRYLGGRYVMFYTAVNTADAVSGEPGCDGDSAIGAATAPSPTGPWTDTGHPVVAPRRNGPGCDFCGRSTPPPSSSPTGAHTSTTAATTAASRCATSTSRRSPPTPRPRCRSSSPTVSRTRSWCGIAAGTTT